MNQQSLEQAAIEACLNIGVQYKSVLADDEWHSTSLLDSHKNKGNGRIRLFCDLRGGIVFNWVTGQSQNFFVNRIDGGSITQQDRAKIKADQQRRKSELIAKQNKAALKAQRIFSSALPATPDHPYLVKKRVKPYLTRQANWTKSVSINGTWKKITIANVLLVPLYNEAGTIRNVQAIFPEKHPDLDRNKDFLAGAELSGLFSWVGNKTETVCIAEGVATAFTVHKDTGFKTYIAFTANNLLAVARIIRKHLPKSKIIVACDNDLKGKVNTGVVKGTEAASAVDGWVVIPPIAGDFNDLYVQQLQEAK